MRKVNLIVVAIVVSLVIVNCAAPKKGVTEKTATEKTEAVKVVTPVQPSAVSFAKDILPALKISCTPCHFPPDGRKEALDTYAAVKSHIGEVLERVKLPKDSRGYMPFMSKKPALSDSTIKVFEMWQKSGMAE